MPATQTKFADRQLIEGGTMQRAHVTATVSPDRVDWVIGPDPMQGLRGEIGPLSEWKALFGEASLRAINATPGITRVAVGVVLLATVENRQDGYRHLQGLLSNVKIQPEVISDFLYQVNYPTAINGVSINRVLKFSVARQLLIQGSMDGTTVSFGEPLYAARFELDFSSILLTPATQAIEAPDVVFAVLLQNAETIALSGEPACFS